MVRFSTDRPSCRVVPTPGTVFEERTAGTLLQDLQQPSRWRLGGWSKWRMATLSPAASSCSTASSSGSSSASLGWARDGLAVGSSESDLRRESPICPAARNAVGSSSNCTPWCVLKSSRTSRSPACQAGGKRRCGGNMIGLRSCVGCPSLRATATWRHGDMES